MDLLNSIKNKIIFVQKLSFMEWVFLIEAWWILFGFYLALRWMSYNRLNKSMPPQAKIFFDSTSQLFFAERLKQLLEISSRLHLLRMTCLVKSSALRWMLLRRGIPVQVRIGVNKTSTGMHAHAWVELQGEPIGEAENVSERFTILESVEDMLCRAAT